MKPGSYGYQEVAKAVQLGIISGKIAKNGTKYFDPSNQLTRGQMAKVIVEAAPLKLSNTTVFSDVPTSNGFHDYISTLATKRITGGYIDGTYQPNKPISRAHFAVFVARMLNDEFRPDKVNTAPKYIFDKTKTYTTEENFFGPGLSSKATYLGSNASWDIWEILTTNEDPQYLLYKEDTTGLYSNFCFDKKGTNCENTIFTELKYPLKVGKGWKDPVNILERQTFTVVSLNQTINTKAGTFKNVVEVKTSFGFTHFYAPNIGIIRTDYNGNQASALTSVK